METRDEDVESDDEIVMLTKRRLKSLLSSRCSCPDPAYDYSFKPDAYENTIVMHCTSCNFKNTSKPEAVIAGRQTSKILRTNISLTYLSVIDDCCTVCNIRPQLQVPEGMFADSLQYQVEGTKKIPHSTR